MIRPNFHRPMIHSAKGSEWEDHKYVLKIDGNYYYPNGYDNGRTLMSLKGTKHEADIEKVKSLSKNSRTGLSTALTRVTKIDDKNTKKIMPVEQKKSVLSKSDNKENGINEEKKEDTTSEDVKNEELTTERIEELALQVIRGNFGNGQTRKDLLGDNYQAIQSRVNELMKAMNVSNIKVSSVSEETIQTGEKALKKAVTNVEKTIAEKGIDMDQVQSVYRKKRQEKRL